MAALMGALITVHTIAARRRRQSAESFNAGETRRHCLRHVLLEIASIDGVLTRLWTHLSVADPAASRAQVEPPASPEDVFILGWIEARYHEVHQSLITLYPEVEHDAVERTRALKEEAGRLCRQLGESSSLDVEEFVVDALRHNASVVGRIAGLDEVEP